MEDIFEAEPSSSGGTIFPFLSVLSCTIGVMTILLVAGSLRAVGFIHNPQIKKAVKVADLELSMLRMKEQDLSKLSSDVEAVKSDVSHIDNLRSLRNKSQELEKRQQDEQARLEGLREEAKRLRMIPVKKGVRVEELQAEADMASAEQERVRSEAEIKSLEERAARAGDRRRELDEKLQSPKKVTVAGEGVEGEPVYVDLAPGAVTVHMEGLSVPKGGSVPRAEATREGGLLDELAMKLARDGSEHYPVLLVRPGAADLFREAERRLRRWRVAFSHEPFDESWVLAVE